MIFWTFHFWKSKILDNFYWNVEVWAVQQYSVLTFTLHDAFFAIIKAPRPRHCSCEEVKKIPEDGAQPKTMSARTARDKYTQPFCICDAVHKRFSTKKNLDTCARSHLVDAQPHNMPNATEVRCNCVAFAKTSFMKYSQNHCSCCSWLALLYLMRFNYISMI